jgi:type I restriction enzyme S subunit
MSAAWLTRSLGEVVAITKGRKPHRLIADSSGDSLPYATADYFRSDIATQFVPSADLASCVLIKKGCPVLIWDGSNAGEVFVGKDAVLASTMALIRSDDSVLDEGFCYFFLKSAFDKLNDGTTGSTIPHVSKHMLTALQIPILPLSEQRLISSMLFKLESAIAVQAQLTDATVELKRAAMRDLFTRGLRGEPQKETEIGLVPEGWSVERLDNRAQVVSTRMSYTELENEKTAKANSVRVVGIKVSDMNRVGNETVIAAAALEKLLDADVAAYRCAPPETIVFPKRGAAIATNKKRLTETWSVFDPNVIGVVPNNTINARFLFHWFQSFDLRTITEPGPTPQLNKKHLDPLLIPVPKTTEEQEEIAAILDALDRKIDLHRKKRAVLEELFKALLHKLMMGEIRVADLDLSALDPHNSAHVGA